MMLRGLSLVFFFMIVNKAYAREFMVGGAKGWTVPSGSQVYSQWAEQSRFQVGDSLMFVYQPNQDSVFQVTRDAYDSCNTDAPTAKFADGKTSFALTHSGPYYFISGNKDNCNKKEKLVVIVMADRNGKTSSPPSQAQAPSGEASPSPPITSNLEPPATTPTSQDTPNKAASSSSSFVAALLGAALASTLFLY
ncbi:hypothetical protein N665_2485s0005 [Sinapis alba]|nr:hypothetical protein N665_2485s0005 [Sinapis alba]